MSPAVCLALTMGDPQGIGPEVLVKALCFTSFPGVGFIALGDPLVFERALRQQGKGQKVKIKKLFKIYRPEQALPAHAAQDTLCVYPLQDPAECVKVAAQWALQDKVSGMVTAPLYKKAFGRYGGHTEFIAHLAGVPRVVMMLVGGGLRVALVTTHLPLRKVFAAVTPDRIFETVKITAQSLSNFFGIKKPRLALAALNPHAGEGGLLGHEEEKLFPPVLRRSQTLRGVRISGPYPPDVVFYKALQGQFDAVIAMYHDQGLGPLKTIAFDSGVNVTLGLPFIRTSPDHGTGRDIAGRNIANFESMKQAITLAAIMARKKKGK